MSQRTHYDAIKLALEADLRAGRRPVLQDIARRVDCWRPTVSRLVNHGLKPNATSAGAPPLVDLLGRHPSPYGGRAAAEPTADALRDRLFGLAVRGTDRADRILTDPTATPAALDQAIRIVVSLTGVVEKLGPAKAKRALRDQEPEPPPPAGPPVGEADIAAAVAGADENPEPRGYENEVG